MFPVLELSLIHALIVVFYMGSMKRPTGTMDQVRGICKAMFGYELPEKIGKFFLKGYRYRSGKGLATVGPIISRYHEEKIKKNR